MLQNNRFSVVILLFFVSSFLPQPEELCWIFCKLIPQPSTSASDKYYYIEVSV